IGNTEVVAGVKLDVNAPYPDTADQGNLIVSCELLPLSSPEFESGPPSIDSIELSRVVDRGIRESHAVDLKKLCIKEGEKVWVLFVDIYPINDDGNLFDAANLAALAALKDARFPDYDAKSGKVNCEERTSKKLPLQNIPMAVTVLKVGKHLLVDPSTNEEHSIDARLTVVSLEDGRVCAMQKGGDMELTVEEINHMVDLAQKKSKELRKVLE
ncbi:MAG: exosome complex protein Rrp42, partial [Nanoarchaeota archaeon]